jgi:hypothetical protein
VDLTLDWIPRLLIDQVERAVLSPGHGTEQLVQVTADLRMRTGRPAIVFPHIRAFEGRGGSVWPDMLTGAQDRRRLAGRPPGRFGTVMIAATAGAEQASALLPPRRADPGGGRAKRLLPTV